MSVTLTAAELATVISRDVSVATRLLPVVSAIVEKYAPARAKPRSKNERRDQIRRPISRNTQGRRWGFAQGGHRGSERRAPIRLTGLPSITAGRRRCLQDFALIARG